MDKNKIITVLLGIILLLIGLIGGYFLGTTSHKEVPNENLSNNNKLNDDEEKELTKDELLAKISGEYIAKLEEPNNMYTGMYITKDTNGEYTYLEYRSATSFRSAGRITEVEKGTNKGQYSLTIYYKAEKNEAFEYNEETVYKTIDITKIDEGIIIKDGTEYKKYNGSFNDWEEKDNFINQN